MSRRDRQRRRDRNSGSAARPLFLTLGVLVTLGLIAVGGAVTWVISVANSAPELRELKPLNQGATSVVYAADGSRLGFIQSDVLRTPVPANVIPTSLKNATVAVEDRRFFVHKGVDFEGVVRAGVKNLESRKTVEGGSTLTMQLVKNLYTGNRQKDFKRKIREAKLAEELENAHPGIVGKRWIRDKYLNNVPYGTVGGQTAVGVQAAARTYFNKPVARLTLAESALLAGLPQAPSEYNPFDAPQVALARRNDVLRRMRDQRFITAATAAKAMAEPLGVEHSRYYTERREGYFFDFVKSELIKRYGVERVRTGGLRINTTVDLKLQKQARAAIASQLNQPGDPSSAIVTIDPSNGYIKAMASSARYGDSKFNLAAQGHRQPGSTFKVMVLMTALRKGVDPEKTTYVSKRLKFTDPTWGPIDVQTYSNTYIGRANLVQATLKSDNSIYEQLDLDLGPKEVAQTAHDMGIKSPLEGYPAEGLGGLKVGVSPLEMANAYATIASGGWRNRATAITKVSFPDGRSDDWGKPRRHKAFSDGVTAEARKILVKNIQGGTGTGASIGCPAGGKTGTTDNFRDAWFVGFTPKLATAVWVGYPKQQIEMRSVHGISVAGGTFPAAIWGAYMKRAKGSYCGDFKAPTDPFVAAPFFGHYATTGGKDTGSGDGQDSSGSPTAIPGGGDPGTGAAPAAPASGPAPTASKPASAPSPQGSKGKGFDPGAYESPAQKPPSTPAAAPAPASASPTGGAAPKR